MSRKPNPEIVTLIERVTRLEERVSALNGEVEELKRYLKRVDSRLWWILGGVILTVLLTLAKLAL